MGKYDKQILIHYRLGTDDRPEKLFQLRQWYPNCGSWSFGRLDEPFIEIAYQLSNISNINVFTYKSIKLPSWYSSKNSFTIVVTNTWVLRSHNKERWRVTDKSLPLLFNKIPPTVAHVSDNLEDNGWIRKLHHQKVYPWMLSNYEFFIMSSLHNLQMTPFANFLSSSSYLLLI